jgi:YidC/Oxa1 family membrane protein insertase
MDIFRTLLIGGLLIVSYLMILAWNDDYGQQPVAESRSEVSDLMTSLPDTIVNEVKPAESNFHEFSTPDNEASQDLPVTVDKAQQVSLISVKTDVLDVRINPIGGQVVSSALLDYSVSLNNPNPLLLLTNSEGRTFTAESALIGASTGNSEKWSDATFRYSSEGSNYRLEEGKDSVEVSLTSTHDQVVITKIFRFTRGSYEVDVEYLLHNQSEETWKGYFAAKLVRDKTPDPTQSSGMGAVSFLGAIISTTEAPYEKYKFSDMEEGKIEIQSTGGWVAFNQHYFLSAWVPKTDGTRKYQIRLKDGKFLIGYVEAQKEVAAGVTDSLGAKLYIGPKIIELLDNVHPNLALTVDFGWLWLIAKPLYLVLKFLHDFVGNWGVAIILLTISIKAIFFHLSAASYRSMANMRRVGPELTRLREQYGDDRQRMSQAMMDLYRKEKINPLGGCLPILVQMPVFIALYWVLLESVELRQAPFFGWIHDLSIKDPYFILPLLMGATMFIQMKLNPTPPDPVQARVMQLMPVIFTVFFLWFPAGLVLYWFVNNLLSIGQQWVITRKIENDGKPAGK